MVMYMFKFLFLIISHGLSESGTLIKTFLTVDFLKHLLYTICDIGGVDMNEFENDPQSKNNDVVDSIHGFVWSFVFFLLIFVIGTIISVTG